MDSLHRDDIDPDTIPPVERALVNHRAYVAAAVSEHQQIVDLLEYVRPDYIPPGCTSTRLIEYGMNLLDLCNRMQGGNVDTRFFQRGMRARVLFGKPVNASMFFDEAAGTMRHKLTRFDAKIEKIFGSLVGSLEERYG
jgi:hypothetical protein